MLCICKSVLIWLVCLCWSSEHLALLKKRLCLNNDFINLYNNVRTYINNIAPVMVLSVRCFVSLLYKELYHIVMFTTVYYMKQEGVLWKPCPPLKQPPSVRSPFLTTFQMLRPSNTVPESSQACDLTQVKGHVKVTLHLKNVPVWSEKRQLGCQWSGKGHGPFLSATSRTKYFP